MLDVCGISKDILSVVKEHLQDLQTMLHRGSSSGEADKCNKIAAYNCYRTKLKKETLKCLKYLKGIRNRSNSNSSQVYMDYNLMVVVDVLSQVRVTAVSIVETLLSLISVPWLEQKSSAYFQFMSKFMRVSGRQRVYVRCMRCDGASKCEQKIGRCRDCRSRP